jgi:SAM-dependent methyltransferase/Tfp pilus assembly protein PilF
MVNTASTAGSPTGGSPVDPDLARRAVAGLAESFGAGDHGTAEVHARLLLRLVPADANLRRILAAAEVAQGKTGSAIRNLRRALLIGPDYVEAQYNLANTLSESGDGELAIRQFGRALCLAPDHVEALINLGNAWAARGRPDRARPLYLRASVAQPPSGLATGNLGALAMISGPAIEAWRHFKRAHHVDPGGLAANLNLANALRELGRIEEAMPHYRRALEIAPGEATVLMAAAEALSRVDGKPPGADSDALSQVLITCLDSPIIESNTVTLASQALMTRDLRAWLSPSPGELDCRALNDLAVKSGGLVPRHLMDSLITDPNLERLLTSARQRLLIQWANGEAAGSAGSVLARALARQAVLNEYLWAVTPNEDRLLDDLSASLVQSIETGAAVDPVDIRLLAAYRPLAPIEPLRRWAARTRRRADPDLAEDLDFLVLDRIQEETIAAGIPDLTPIDDEISTLVKAQYEDNPYPRWNSLARHQPIGAIEQILQEIAPNRPALEPLPPEPRVLIAGCGTGRQPIQAAMAYRGATVLAIDLSLPSLAYAKRKSGQLAIDNIQFARADILGLGDLVDRFDIIECSGVLHHMAEPAAGLRSLLSVLAPNGLLKIALYSAAARTNVTRLRHWIAERGFAPTLEGIRAFREILPASGHPDAEATSRSIDYNATSAIRDLLFHAQEHQFTIAGLKRILAGGDLEFLGFLFRDPSVKANYLNRFPGDGGCVDLDNWALFENDNPLTFVSMYQFWCRRIG